MLLCYYFLVCRCVIINVAVVCDVIITDAVGEMSRLMLLILLFIMLLCHRIAVAV